MKSLLLYIVFVISSIAVLSCTGIERQEPKISVPENFRNIQGGPVKGASYKKWWEEFKDERLNALIEEALRQNHDIRTATERVLQARADLGISHALRFPTLQMNLSVARQRQTTMGITSHTNTFNINLMLSYEADLWGRLSSGQKKALATLGSVEEARRVILQGVVSDLVKLYLHAKALREMIVIRQEYISNANKNLEIIKGRYRVGRASYLDVLQAQSLLSEAMVQIEPLRRQLKDTLYRISVLAGRYPQEITLSNIPVSAYIKDLEPVPPGLPSELLLRRPDIRAGLFKAEEAFQALKVARAQRFPSISLTAQGGWVSSELKDLFRPESLFWQLSAGVLQPIFNAGRLKAQEEAAKARYRESVIEYAKTVLQAFYEVEKALSDRKGLYEERKRLAGLVIDLDRTYRVALERYRSGLIELSTVLQLQRQLYEARLRLINTDEAILTNRVFLYRALGGKWTEEKPWEYKGEKR